ncbi:GDP-L-fucose synthase [Thalassotalea euphylliae]|uniref:GDP-L-fucose synthase n=1 Tax=Thalassotalea euphylliae TaxID=1655234 RepID=A0A3E0U579_9GAMM|nr:GDP-L-fucose synthase [Thalassotalea euphylliae]REL31949.1 GDP-L-fucose synthase [Thalassotalea euphylliae]
MPNIKPKQRVFVAGHKGMVGSALVRKLALEPSIELVTCARKQLDLTDQQAVFEFLAAQKIDQIYLAAARVGGIHANNTYPAEFIYENLAIQNNIIHGAHLADVDKLLFLGSSCIYPKLALQPMAESALLTNTLEPTNEPYAIAKIAGIKMCESYNRQYGRQYRSVMPTNLHGSNDNYHPENSHAIPALIQRFHQAKIQGDSKVVAWGSGKPMREFLYVDDMADASVFVMNLDNKQYQASTQEMLSHINVGTGEDCTIKTLVETVAKVVGFDGEIVFDTSKPDGAPRKLMDVSRLSSLGWRYQISLQEGLAHAYQWYVDNVEQARSH